MDEAANAVASERDGTAAQAHGGAAVPDLDSVLREHGPMLDRIAGSYQSEPGRREDLLQEISLALWRALPGWRGEASLRTFIARVAHNRAIDYLARHRRVEDSLDETHPDPGDDPLRHAEAQQRRRNLLDAVRQLPLGQRQVVVLALEGFSLRETGAALGLEENTVAQRLSRARRQLRDSLGASA
ncbi:RNA polymerase sigma factor [Lysobacter silvisoli]|uniref:Sigma-70 family RNA polymerase sigma factor n=1 Tax=Lysobacter silvisoli TaxID=2293254 RepID=A0A371K0C8_9GAMM|nr:sigma-70 family RNA polymerase sigma factor [Lysobacter silvisoli]RDZ27365.1 sigma-70 family RNA polymerase sigma factor [Lysobacter silvisoli]